MRVAVSGLQYLTQFTLRYTGRACPTTKDVTQDPITYLGSLYLRTDAQLFLGEARPSKHDIETLMGDEMCFPQPEDQGAE